MEQATINEIQQVREALELSAKNGNKKAKEALQAWCNVNQEMLIMSSDLAQAQDEIQELRIDLDERACKSGEVAHG